MVGRQLERKIPAIFLPREGPKGALEDFQELVQATTSFKWVTFGPQTSFHLEQESLLYNLVCYVILLLYQIYKLNKKFLTWAT